VQAIAARRIPLLLISARVSARSVSRYRRWVPDLMRATARGFALIAAQSAADRERFIALGAEPARVCVVGNLKFDLPLPPDVAGRGAELRERVASHRPMWVAGSTHEGEEAICLAAQRALRAAADAACGPAPLLVLAPRRPERFEAVAQWLRAQGLRYIRYSAVGEVAGGAGDEVDVLLVDRFGELLKWYGAADVCFVGGTLIPIGGHNLLEPAVLGKPVVAGPHCSNVSEATLLLTGAGALRQVHNGEELAQVLRQWLSDPSEAARVGGAGAAAVAANRGAAVQAVQAITVLLASESSKPAAASPSAAG
jgi:3-deoxy-D-manno-octulosonic-acid transferase